MLSKIFLQCIQTWPLLEAALLQIGSSLVLSLSTIPSQETKEKRHLSNEALPLLLTFLFQCWVQTGAHFVQALVLRAHS